MTRLEKCTDLDRKGEAVDLLIEGFLDDPFFVWATPDEGARLTLLESMFSLVVEAAVAEGFLAMDTRGVVVLVPPGRRLYDDQQAAAVDTLILEAFQPPPELLGEYRRKRQSTDLDDADSWYLQYLVVPTVKRSRGLGSSLMKDILAKVAGAPLWLHTGREENLAFYAKFKMHVIATTACEPGGPYIYTLHRP